MVELGEQLKKAREAQSVSLDSISEITKINEKYLAYIEKGEWDFLPQPYVRGFVKMFAKEVGLDGEQILHKYDRILVEKKHSLSDLSEEADSLEKLLVAKDETGQNFLSQLPNYVKQHKAETLFISIALVILIILIRIYSQNSNDIFDEPIQAINEPLVDTLIATQPDSTALFPSPDKLIELMIRAKAETWIALSVDDSASAEYTFYPGISKVWYGKQYFNLRIGNSKGVELFLNGQPLELKTQKGRVLEMDIDAEGIIEK